MIPPTKRPTQWETVLLLLMGFDWSTIKTENVTVEVKDEEGGLYSYLVEIYTEDPLTNENASVLATRTANKENNFKATAAITLLPTQKGI